MAAVQSQGQKSRHGRVAGDSATATSATVPTEALRAAAQNAGKTGPEGNVRVLRLGTRRLGWATPCPGPRTPAVRATGTDPFCTLARGTSRPRGDVSPSGAGKTYGLYSLFKEQLMRKTATSRNHRLEGNYAIKKIRGCGSRRRTVKLEAGAGEGSLPRRAPPAPTRSPGTGRAGRPGRQDRQATEPGPSLPMSLPLPRRAPARWTWGGVPAPRWPCPQTRPPAGFSPSCKGPLYPDSQTG